MAKKPDANLVEERPKKVLSIRESDLLPHQVELIMSEAPLTCLVSGYGGGKSYALQRAVIKNLITNKRESDGKSAGWVLYPTLDMAREIFVDDFLPLLERTGIKYKFNSQRMTVITQYGFIRVYTLDNPRQLIGSNLTWVMIDEFDTLEFSKAMQVYNRVIGRLRGNSTSRLYIATTPEGHRATYHLLVENPRKEQRLIRAKTTDNKFLPESYIQNLRDNYDEKLLQAYLNGEFVNLTSGSVYYGFDRGEHVTDAIKLIPNYPINIMFDFNVFPMTVLWGQSTSQDDIRFLGEWVSKRHSNTEEACFNVIESLPSDSTVIVYGDASGSYQSANSNHTNYDIIDNIFRSYFKSVEYRVPSANPAVRNRVNCFNARLSKKAVRIHPRCARLIADLEQVVWNEKGSDLDKSNLNLTHATDAAGYFVTWEYPIIVMGHDVVKTQSIGI